MILKLHIKAKTAGWQGTGHLNNLKAMWNYFSGIGGIAVSLSAVFFIQIYDDDDKLDPES